MTNKISFFLPGLLPSRWLSPNRGEIKKGRVPALITEAKREMRGDVAVGALSYVNNNEPFERSHVFICLRWYKRRKGDGKYRPEDAGNAIYALKSAIDGLIDARIIVDDGYKNVPLLTGSVERCDSFDEEGLYVSVSELPSE